MTERLDLEITQRPYGQVEAGDEPQGYVITIVCGNNTIAVYTVKHPISMTKLWPAWCLSTQATVVAAIEEAQP